MKLKKSLLRLVAVVSLTLLLPIVAAAASNCSDEIIDLLDIEAIIADQQYIYELTCKPAPQNNNILIAAFVHSKPFIDDVSTDDLRGQLAVFTIDLAKQRVIAKTKRDILQDAVWHIQWGGGSYLTIDTGKYILNNSTRAFGIIEKGFKGSRGMDGGMGAQVTLYIQSGRKLIPLLSDVRLSRYEYIRADTNEIIDDKEYETTISMLKTKTNGFYDILLVTKEKPSKEIKTQKLKYNGKVYR